MIKFLKHLPYNIYYLITGYLWWKSGQPNVWWYFNNWRCVRRSLKNGWVYNKNGLPLIVHRVDGYLLEHEAADHPDYQFPVWIDLSNENNRDADYYHWTSVGEDGTLTRTPMTEEEIMWEKYSDHEYHAFLGVENGVIKTAYEYCYAYWDYETGTNIPGPDKHTDLWKSEKWNIREEDLFKIKKWFENNRMV
jgi:hypothetical protein